MKNKEIEELLNTLKDEDDYIEEYGYSYKRIALDDCWLLLSYIEQLENEIEQFKTRIKTQKRKRKKATHKKNIYKEKIEQLEKRNKELYEGFMATQEELTDYATKNEQLEADDKEANESITWWTNRFNAVERDKKQLENNRDKAIEYVEEKGRLKYNPNELIKLLKGDSE